MLLKAGMTVKQAIVYNLLSALMAYFGMVIGTAVGQYTHNVTSWIFAVTAGMFLYVALVDMVSINTGLYNRHVTLDPIQYESQYRVHRSIFTTMFKIYIQVFFLHFI